MGAIKSVVSSVIRDVGRSIGGSAFSWSSYWPARSLRDFKEVIKKSDGYYLKDYSSNELDAKLTKSIEGVFTTAQYVSLTGTPFDETIALTDDAVNVYEFDVAITDLTRNISVDDNMVLKNVLYPYVKGFMLRVNLDKIEIALSTSNDGAGKQVITSLISIPDHEYHHWKVTVDTTTGARKVTFQIDDTIDTPVDITCSGAVLHGNHAVCTLGGGSSCARMKLANFRLIRDGVMIYDMPISTNYERVFDRVTGTVNSGNNTHTWGTANDFYPANILNGYEYYDNATIRRYVPIMVDGALITPAIVGYIKYGSVIASGYFNYSETQIQPNPTDETVLGTLYDDTVYWHSYDIMQLVNDRVFLHGSQTGLERIGITLTDQSIAEKAKIQTGFGNTIVKTGLFFGDSISQGAGAANADLPAYLSGDILNTNILFPNFIWTQVPPSKVDFLEQLNKNNDFPPVRDNPFNGPDLCYSYLSTQDGSNFYVVKLAFGGYICGTDAVNNCTWEATDADGAMPKYLQMVPRAIEEIRKNSHEPSFDMFICLGTNDSSFSNAVRDAFATNMTAVIAAVRAVVGTDNDVNILRVRMVDADTIIVGNLTTGLKDTISRCYIYDSSDLDYTDGVHPSTDGNIQIATLWKNKTSV